MTNPDFDNPYFREGVAFIFQYYQPVQVARADLIGTTAFISGFVVTRHQFAFSALNSNDDIAAKVKELEWQRKVFDRAAINMRYAIANLDEQLVGVKADLNARLEKCTADVEQFYRIYPIAVQYLRGDDVFDELYDASLRIQETLYS